MRGLKRDFCYTFSLFEVASFTDAWIETFNPEFDHIGYQVASFTDAWIETEGKSLDTVFGYVASFTDAWIETPDALKSIKSLPSHLLQMRGLKLYQGNWDICIRRRIFYRCVD